MKRTKPPADLGLQFGQRFCEMAEKVISITPEKKQRIIALFRAAYRGDPVKEVSNG